MVEEINKEFCHSFKIILNMNGFNLNKLKENNCDYENKICTNNHSKQSPFY